jgi:hypothetical protein
VRKIKGVMELLRLPETFVPGGPAQRSGEVSIGDVIVSVDSTDVLAPGNTSQVSFGSSRIHNQHALLQTA